MVPSRKSTHTEASEAVSADYSNERLNTIFDDRLKHAGSTEYIKTVIAEYVGTHSFVLTIKEYAAEAYEDRILKSGKYWASIILTTIITSLVAYGINYFLK